MERHVGELIVLKGLAASFRMDGRGLMHATLLLHEQYSPDWNSNIGPGESQRRVLTRQDMMLLLLHSRD